MIVYHGTNSKRAHEICLVGFLPKPPTRRVWFSRTYHIASNRAKYRAKNINARPVVLTCDLDLDALRRELGAARVVQHGHIVTVRGPVPASVIVSPHKVHAVPRTCEEIAQWANGVLGLKAFEGVSPRHPGVDRFARWVTHRLAVHPEGDIDDEEWMKRARQWLPAYFEVKS